MRSTIRRTAAATPLRASLRKAGSLWVWSVLLLPLLAGATACEDDIFKVRWEEDPDTVVLHSLARPELNLLSGFDFISRIPIRIESPDATGRWDVVLDTQEGELVLLTPGALGVTGSEVGIAPMGAMEFDAVRSAPSDTARYVRDDPVQIEVGQVYVVRTRQQSGIYGQRCVYYGKFEPLEEDAVAGRLKFQFDVSPVCNSRKLYPPKD